MARTSIVIASLALLLAADCAGVGACVRLLRS